jgi:hypothetical protein
MSTPTGGLRLRLIADSIGNMIEDSLTQLGWLTPSLERSDVRFTTEQLDPNVQITPNTVGLSTDDELGEEVELGSGLMENRWDMYVDVFAENTDVGLHLAGDIRDIIRGKMSSIGRIAPICWVYDLRNATPDQLFYVEFEDVDMVRDKSWRQPKNRFWWTIHMVVLDSYDTDED